MKTHKLRVYVTPILLLLVILTISPINLWLPAISKSVGNPGRQLKPGCIKDLSELKAKGFSPSPPAAPHKTRRINFQLNPKDYVIRELKEGFLIDAPGLARTSKPGAPELPVKVFEVTFKGNVEIIDVKVVKGRYFENLDKIPIAPCPEPVAWSPKKSIPTPWRKPDEKVYKMKKIYPGSLLKYSVGNDGKSTRLIVWFYPIQYVPADGKIFVITEATINVYYTEKTETWEYETLMQTGVAHATDKWTRVTFQEPFSTTPVIVAQIMSEKGTDNCHIDLKNPSTTGFYVRVEEDLKENGVHKVREAIAWIAVLPGVYRSEGKTVVAGTISANQEWTHVSFPANFNSTPVIIATIMTENGGDPCYVDMRNATATGFDVRVEEDPLKDGKHIKEKIGWIAFGEKA